MSRLAEALGVPEEFLLRPPIIEASSAAISYRKRNDARRAICDRASFAVEFADADLVPMMRQILQVLPENVLPDLTGVNPALAAKEVRAMWGLHLAPILNVVSLLEAKGVRVFSLDDSSPSLGAFACWCDGEPYMFLNSSIQDGCQQRFNAAHELGHLVLHREVNFERSDYRTIEREADTFASHFLLSDAFLREAPPTFQPKEMFALKPRWKSTVSCMVRRLYDASRFTDWQFESANIWLAKQGYRSNPEPLAGEVDESILHARWVAALAESDTSPLRLINDLGLPRDTVCAMMPAVGRSLAALALPYDYSQPGPGMAVRESIDGI